MRPRSLRALVFTALTATVAVPVMVTGAAGQAPAPVPAYVPERVYDPARGVWIDFEVMLADLARADVVFVGEQHDDPNTHRLELAVLDGVGRRRAGVVLSLEMFERDVQRDLNRFAAGQIGDEAFLSFVRPWPRYRTDYKPLVDFAIGRRWPIVAANVPRALASEVSKTGWAALESRPASERPWFAAARECPTDDEYYRRFAAAMAGHPADPPAAGATTAAPDERTARYYFAQCLKDETMAESIARVLDEPAGGDAPLVVHINGAFHSDFGLGTAERTRRRAPGRRVVVVTMLPVADLDTVTPDDDARQRADYLVYTLRSK
ncbi:MAG TPA: ChaN family lipoprotein [Vicinamibacterales bacterium]|nr:ChaN family lipoprotein [Vicinamibacterales bacterium]